MNPEMENKKGMSIIVPFLNEEDGIELFCREFDHFAGTLDFPIETVFVNDGSTDSTLDLLQKQQFYNIQKVKVLNLSRNFGSHAAIRAGVLHSSYPICTWLGCCFTCLDELWSIICSAFTILIEDKPMPFRSNYRECDIAGNVDFGLILICCSFSIFLNIITA